MTRSKLRGADNDLHRAIQRGDLTAVREWVAAGKPLDDRDSTLTTPLALAAYFDKPAIFEELLAAGAGTQPTDDGNHVLFYAAWRGNRQMMQALLERKADVNFQCKDETSTGQTALMGAVKGGHLAIAKLLVAHHADLGLTDKNGQTALDYADESGEDEIVKYLKRMKAPGKPIAPKKPAKPHPGEKIVAKGRKVIERFPELAAKPKYQKFLTRLTKLLGRKPKAYVNPDAFEYGKLKGVYAVTLPAQSLADQPDLLADLATEVAKAGGTLVEAELGQDPRNGLACVLFPTTNKVAVILAQETSSNGIVGAETEDIAAVIAELEKDNPFRLTICAHDTIAGEFDGPLRKATTVARRLLDICPGDEDYRPADVGASLKRDGYFVLWWD